MKDLNEYRQAILGWARDRNLIEGSTPAKQIDKLFEELGEFAGAAARSGVPEKREAMLLKMQDGIGDAFVVMCILAEQMSIALDFTKMERYNDCVTNRVMYLTAGCLAGLSEALERGVEQIDNVKNAEHFYFAISSAEALAESLGFVYLDCVAMVWNEIKDRKGRMIDGVFVKEADLV